MFTRLDAAKISTRLDSLEFYLNKIDLHNLGNDVCGLLNTLIKLKHEKESSKIKTYRLPVSLL